MTELSTKPYLIRAIYEWCADAGFTPYIGVHVDQNTRVPVEYVKNGEIVLSIGMQATLDLTIGNDLVQFSARFGGVSREIAVPIYAIASIFARENGKGMYFEPELPPLASASTLHAGVPQLAPQPALQAVPSRALVTAPTTSSTTIPAPSTESADGNEKITVASLAAIPSEERDAQSNTDAGGNNKASGAEDGAPKKPKGPPRGKLRVIK